MSELLSAIDAHAVTDVHQVAESVLLVTIEELITARDRLDGVLALHLQAADVRQVMVSYCGRSTRSWLVEEAHLCPDEASRRMGVARMVPFHPGIGAALVAGEINHDHARVIATCLRKLPSSWREVAEAELVTAAREVDPAALAGLCKELRLRSGADQDAEAAAQRIYDSRWATVSRTFEGMIHLEAMLDPESGATLTAALAPLLERAGERDTRRSELRRTDALINLAQFSLTHGELPDHGGDRPTVVVTIPYAELRDRIPAGQQSAATVNGVPISASVARRIACDANIIPAVLGGASEVLDLGRSRRTFSRAQRHAAALRDKGCVWPKCQTQLARCELHHPTYWEHGGPTNHHNSAYVCRFHHWLIHHTPWTLTRNAQGQIEVSRT